MRRDYDHVLDDQHAGLRQVMADRLQRMLDCDRARRVLEAEEHYELTAWEYARLRSIAGRYCP